MPPCSLAAEAFDLGAEIEWPDRRTGGEIVGVEEVCGNDPDDLELDPVGVLGVEALGGAVIAGADQGAPVS